MMTHTDLIRFPTFEERLSYLRVDGPPSEIGFDKLRFLNQKFYQSSTWKRIRSNVISRDLGFDLGIPGREIIGKVIVHHMNVLKPKDIINHSDIALDPEYLITVSYETHQAIHFGSPIREPIQDRFSGDTKLW